MPYFLLFFFLMFWITSWLASQLGRDWHPDEVFYCMNEFILDRGSEMSLNRLGVTIDGVEVRLR